MHFPRDIFTLLGVGMVAVLANELETGITFNDKMTLMMVSQLFLAFTHTAAEPHFVFCFTESLFQISKFLS